MESKMLKLTQFFSTLEIEGLKIKRKCRQNSKSQGQKIMLKTILGALLLFFSINGIVLAVDNEIFEVEAESRYPKVAGTSIELAKK